MNNHQQQILTAIKKGIVNLVAEKPHELTFSKIKLVEKTTYPENMPQTFNHWLLEMTRIGVNFKWYKNEFKLKETKTINLTSK